MLNSGTTYTLQAELRNIRLRSLLVALLALCAATSCDSPEARVADTAPVRVDVDWSACGETVPTGMTILFHHVTGGEKTVVIDNDVTHATPRLSSGRYWATVINLTENEYESIRFRGLESPETAEAYLSESNTSNWYAAHHEDGGCVAGQPEWLAVDTIMTAPVIAPSSATQVAGVLHPRLVTRNLHMIIHVGNIGNLLAARGALSGLAAGHRLAADCPNDNSVTVTHLIESNSWSCMRTSPDMGTVEADINCFGLPANHQGTPDENFLTFQALLADGKTVKSYRIPVGHLIRDAVSPSGHASGAPALLLELILDPQLPPCSGGEGGIDVWFDDWDENVDYNVVL